MNAILKITEATGNNWKVVLLPDATYSIGRAKDNDIVLNDRQVSRRHAQITTKATIFRIIDGYFVNNELQRSVNRVFINGKPHLEKILESGDLITIGETRLEFERVNTPKPTKIPRSENKIVASMSADVPRVATKIPTSIKYDDKPLGHTQFLISAAEIIGNRSNLSIGEGIATAEEIKELRRKAKALDLLYEMSKTLGSIFDLKEIFVKATDLIFRATPAERVVALLMDETTDGKTSNYNLSPIAIRARDKKLESLTEKLTISRTITQKVMREKVALLSQDAAADAQFSSAESIVAQGIRSTICAPLITESNIHGVVYADRFNPFAAFNPDDLALISAVAAQTAVTVETVKAHKRLAREEVARANYSRFMPEYVVKQLLENPDSFKLGGINQTITVLFADIRGFTTFSETEKPENVVGLLNRYFSAMSEIIFAHGGTLDKYIGDGLMAIFGAPTATPDDAENAVKTAVAMQKRLTTLNKELEFEGLRPIKIGIGLHTGEATIGYIGSEQRSEYTAIGDTVNVASRLEKNTTGGQILISEATAKASGNLFHLIACKPLTVKNRLQSISLFEVKWN
ncbi:MAG: FHA domain-containing protein [Acidobacteria bacterium]|nr:FHA domain-containing protein [Acidobacteriota bacterium]MCA1639015.1 FHA domain-containing protein [Acidobacteriota bacterium]